MDLVWMSWSEAAIEVVEHRCTHDTLSEKDLGQEWKS